MNVLKDKEDLLGLKYSLTSLGTKMEDGIERLIAAQERQHKEQTKETRVLCALLAALVFAIAAPYIERLAIMAVEAAMGMVR